MRMEGMASKGEGETRRLGKTAKACAATASALVPVHMLAPMLLASTSSSLSPAHPHWPFGDYPRAIVYCCMQVRWYLWQLHQRLLQQYPLSCSRPAWPRNYSTRLPTAVIRATVSQDTLSGSRMAQQSVCSALNAQTPYQNLRGSKLLNERDAVSVELRSAQSLPAIHFRQPSSSNVIYSPTPSSDEFHHRSTIGKFVIFRYSCVCVRTTRVHRTLGTRDHWLPIRHGECAEFKDEANFSLFTEIKPFLYHAHLPLFEYSLHWGTRVDAARPLIFRQKLGIGC